MPWTFAHPIAILPFRRLSPKYANVPALVIGSISPDFSFYGSPFDFSAHAHTFLGSLLVCLPTSLVALTAFYYLREPVTQFLPQPHRDALLPIARVKPEVNLRFLFIVAVSILVGAWTHIFVDGFTHEHGWAAEYFPALRENLFSIGSVHILCSSMLQYLSSLVGTILLVALYLRWLQSQKRGVQSSQWQREQNRHLVLATVAVISIIAATIVAFHQAGRHFDVRAFIVHISMHAVTVFTVLLVSLSLLHGWINRRKTETAHRCLNLGS